MPANFLLRGGRVFVAVRNFYDNLQYDHGISSNSKPWNGVFAWDGKTRSVLMATGGARRKTIRIAENANTFLVDGKVFSFPTKTFVIGQRDRQTLYAPLAPLVAALGGKLKVNSTTLRVWYEIPA